MARWPQPVRARHATHTLSYLSAGIATFGAGVIALSPVVPVADPALQPHLYNEQGGLRPFVNIFLGEENVKDLQGPDTPLRENDRLLLIPSIAGGAPAVEKTLTKRK